MVCLEACVEYSMCVSRLRYTMKSTSDSGNSSLLQPPPSTAFLNPCSCSRRAEFKNGLRTSSPNKNRGDALGICAKGLATISDSLSLFLSSRAREFQLSESSSTVQVLVLESRFWTDSDKLEDSRLPDLLSHRARLTTANVGAVTSTVGAVTGKCTGVL